jgi:hypothetical protein
MKKINFCFFVYTLAAILLLNVVFIKTTQGTVPSTNSHNCATDLEVNIPPIANNDTFRVLTGCGGNLSFTANILANDIDPNGDEIAILLNIRPKAEFFQNVEFFRINNTSGELYISFKKAWSDSIKFRYYIVEKTENEYRDLGEVVIYIQADNDCDSIEDWKDIDDDNDGILDVDEGDTQLDSDNDGVPDSYDIDSDNDGITDNQEWQQEGYFIFPQGKDLNTNGWDDAYDISMGGVYYSPEDTNNNGIPDYLDSDTDNDGINDIIEGADINNDGICDIISLGCDNDKNGMDDAFDIIASCVNGKNVSSSSSSLQDSNNNGIRDWREPFENKDVNDSDILIFPNPASDKFSVSTMLKGAHSNLNFSLFSMNGTLIYENSFSIFENSFDVSGLENGVYIAKIQSELFSVSKPVVVKH